MKLNLAELRKRPSAHGYLRRREINKLLDIAEAAWRFAQVFSETCEEVTVITDDYGREKYNKTAKILEELLEDVEIGDTANDTPLRDAANTKSQKLLLFNEGRNE